jgi:hypothetical protein
VLGERYQSQMCVEPISATFEDVSNCGQHDQVRFEECKLHECQPQLGVLAVTTGEWGLCTAACTDVTQERTPTQARCAWFLLSWDVKRLYSLYCLYSCALLAVFSRGDI